MPGKEYIAELGGWQGFTVGTVGRTDSRIWIELFPDPQLPMVCSRCGQVAEQLHEWTERWVRDLPCWGAQTSLLVHLRRVECTHCGTSMERVAWLSPYARVTNRLAENVAWMCRVMPIRHVAKYYGLSWDTVKRIHKEQLRKTLGEPDLSDVTLLAIDDFSIRKGHRFATVIVEPQTRRVLWVCRGRSRQDIRGFFVKLGKQGREKIKAVAMDMWEPYEKEVKFQCRLAVVVYDLFHVKSRYAHEVIDRVRVDEANRLKQDKPARKIVKGTKWILLANPSSLRTKDQVRLTELLAANKQLAIVHILKDDLAQLWNFDSEWDAWNSWEEWYKRALESQIAPLIKFALGLKKKIYGILSHCKYPLNTSILEGINNKIKVIKRMAYGFRDDEYFFLRIREAFPGIRG